MRLSPDQSHTALGEWMSLLRPASQNAGASGVLGRSMPALGRASDQFGSGGLDFRTHLSVDVRLSRTRSAICSVLSDQEVCPDAVPFCSAASIGALLSNEQGVVLLPLTMLLAYFLVNASSRRWLALALVGVGVDGVYLAARRMIHAQTPGGTVSVSTVGTVFLKYVLWILFPIHMSVERSTDYPARGFSITAAATLAALLCLLVFAYWLRNRVRLAAFGLIWAMISLLPFCGIVPVYQGMAERYAYLASFGLVVSIVALAWSAEGRKRSVLLSIVLLWALWSAWRLRSRVFDWTDPVQLYQSSLRKLNFTLRSHETSLQSGRSL